MKGSCKMDVEELTIQDLQFLESIAAELDDVDQQLEEDDDFLIDEEVCRCVCDETAHYRAF
jgi:hypothetical protein